MIKVVFLDIGNVLVDFDLRKLLQEVVTDIGKPHHEVLKFFLTTGLAEKYEKGLISTAELFETVRRDLSYTGTIERFTESWNGIFTENAGGVQAFHLIKRTRPVYLASNTNELHYAHLDGRYPFLKLADGAVLSHKVHARKPEPDFYRKAAEIAGIAPADAVLIDDMADNIEGARRAGMHGVVFTGLEPLRQSLKPLGLDI